MKNILWKVEGRRERPDCPLMVRSMIVAPTREVGIDRWLYLDGLARRRALDPEQLPEPWRPEELTLTPIN